MFIVNKYSYFIKELKHSDLVYTFNGHKYFNELKATVQKVHFLTADFSILFIFQVKIKKV